MRVDSPGDPCIAESLTEWDEISRGFVNHAFACSQHGVELGQVPTPKRKPRLIALISHLRALDHGLQSVMPDGLAAFLPKQDDEVPTTDEAAYTGGKRGQRPNPNCCQTFQDLQLEAEGAMLQGHLPCPLEGAGQLSRASWAQGRHVDHRLECQLDQGALARCCPVPADVGICIGALVQGILHRPTVQSSGPKDAE